MALRKEDFDLERNQLTIWRKIELCWLEKTWNVFNRKIKKPKSSKAKVEIKTLYLVNTSKAGL